MSNLKITADELEKEYERLNLQEDKSSHTSKYTGVSWETRRGMWRAKVEYNKKDFHLDYFPDERDAALAVFTFRQTHPLPDRSIIEISKAKKLGMSKYRGISLDRRLMKWKAEITKGCKRYYLGIFKLEIDAAKAYNKKAIELYGDKANLNIVV